MSLAAIGPILSAVGTVLAAKTAIEGLKEGNLFKAVLGGVGAYVGMTGLAGGAASSIEKGAAGAISKGSMTGNLLNPEIATAGNAVANPDIMSTALNSVDSLGSDAANIFNGSNAISSSALDLVGSDAGANALQSVGANSLGSSIGAGADSLASVVGSNAAAPGMSVFGTPLPEQATGLSQITGGIGDFLGKANNFIKENGALTKVGGQILSGYSQGKQQEELLRQAIQQRDAERARRGGAVDIGLSGYRFNPTTRQLEPVM